MLVVCDLARFSFRCETTARYKCLCGTLHSGATDLCNLNSRCAFCLLHVSTTWKVKEFVKSLFLQESPACVHIFLLFCHFFLLKVELLHVESLRMLLPLILFASLVCNCLVMLICRNEGWLDT